MRKMQERKVEYVELIYDLIFVYLVSRNVSLLQHVTDGFVTPLDYFSYVASTMVALQIWYISFLYINHYGDGSPREHLMMFVNMYLLYYMAEGIRTDWGPVYVRYHVTWALIILNLALHFYLAARTYNEEDEELRRHRYRYAIHLVIEAGMILISIPIYAYTGLALSPWALVFGLVVMILYSDAEKRMLVDFPHMAERVMLYIIFTFGEMVLGITGYFDDGFSPAAIYFSLMAFAIVVGLFSAYEYYYNHLMDPETKTSGFKYMMIHIAMVFALNNVTAAMKFMQRRRVDVMPKTLFMAVSILAFFICLLATQEYSKYNKGGGFHYYTRFAFTSVIFVGLMLALSNIPFVSIALTVAFIYLQLCDMYFGKKET